MTPGVQYQQIPFGTVKQCEVADVFIHGKSAGLMLIPEGERIPTICLFDKASADGVAKGDRGSMTFTPGGPLGGYWKFSKESADGRSTN